VASCDGFSFLSACHSFKPCVYYSICCFKFTDMANKLSVLFSDASTKQKIYKFSINSKCSLKIQYTEQHTCHENIIISENNNLNKAALIFLQTVRLGNNLLATDTSRTKTWHLEMSCPRPWRVWTIKPAYNMRRLPEHS